MFEIVVNKRKAVARQSEILTSGSAGILASFIFSQDWEGLSRTAVFSNGSVTRDVVLYGSDCVIPHECLVTSGKTLTVGVYGTNGETIVIPTVYCALGRVLQGADPSGDPSIPPTPTAVQQIMSAAANAVNIAQSVRDDADAGAFDGTDGYSPSVTITDIEGGHRVTITDEAHPQGQSFDVLDGQGGGGTGDHRQLTHRDAADQHPMSAITGLVSALAGKQATISDIAEIRAGAELGGTAVQTETDPTVPAWAKQPTKPAYSKADVGLGNVDNVQQYSASNPPPYPVTSVNGKTGAAILDAEDVGALPDDTTIPSELSQLTGDSTHRTVTDAEKATWNAKSDFSGAYADLTGKPTIPDELADLASDSTHRTVTDTEKETWNAKGTYSKPSGGIPKTDLASAVQTSLGLADSALQEHQSLAAYRTSAAQDTIDGGKVDKVTGKGLSTNDFTTAYKDAVDANTTARHTHSNKSVLDGITSALVSAWSTASTWVSTNGANVLSHLSDTVKHITSAERTAWNAKQSAIDASNKLPYEYISGTPTIPTVPTNVSAFTNDAGYLTQHQSLTAYRTATAQDAIDATKADKPTIKSVMDAVAAVNTMYFLGTQSAVSIVLPSSASAGDQLSVVWYNGATAATLSITGTVLTVDYTPSANSRSELNAMWDGTYWAVVTNEQALPEVTV